MQKVRWPALTLLVLATALSTTAAWAVPTQINYQGFLTDSAGTPLDGSYQIRFSLWDAAVAGSSVWPGGEELAVSVAGGVFNVHLGAANPILPSMLAAEAIYLQIDIYNAAGGVWEAMSPRQLLTSTAFAMRAGDSETLGGMTGADYALSSHGHSWSDLTGVPAGLEDGDDVGITSESDPTVPAAVKDGIGWSEISDIPADIADGDDTGGITEETDPTVSAAVKDGVSWDEVGGKPAGFADNVDNTGILVESDPQVGTIGVNRLPRWDGAALSTGVIFDDGSGNVGIGTELPSARLSLGTEWPFPASPLKRLAMWDNHTGTDFYGFGIDTGRIDIYTANAERMTILNNGYVGIGKDTPVAMLDVWMPSSVTDPWHPAIHGRNEGAGDGVIAVSTNRHGLYAVTSSSDTSSAAVFAKNNGTGPAIWAEGNCSINGRTTTQVLQITGGSDLSEKFDVRPMQDDSPPSPGMVVSIDPEKPGRLQVSAEPYDRRVAGIISGAGNVATGMLMGQSGTDADGATPVALTGRVYCLVDASYGAIEPGDLLTTSQTPGHAMKVHDHSRAPGATLGKAMGGLGEGRGMVLVLVNLQ